MTEEQLLLITTTLFGLCIGSFLNVCIYRVPKELSVNVPKRSFCPKCERQLSSWENIPVLSWLILRGKCKGCSQKISIRYPFVELITGIAAAACFIKFGFTLTALILFLLTAALIVITFIDFDEKIIPNVISFPGMTIGLILGCVSQYTDLLAPPLTSGAMDSLLGFLFGGLFFLIIGEIYYRMTGVVGLGGGDIKLTAMIGAILGTSALIPTIFGGSIMGCLVGLVLMVIQGSGRKTEIAFGPWLALGAILYVFVDLPLFRILPS